MNSIHKWWSNGLLTLLLISSCAIFIANGEIFHNVKFPIPKKLAIQNIYKVELTQQGYIQFLRYITDVPKINEFTYCIWVKSINFTYSHPLLSYSFDEEDRIIRGWIGPYGRTINLAINEVIVYKHPVHLKEHQWYHICQSWDSSLGYSSVHLNGKLLHSEYNEKVRGITLREKGDIVVGQEYTDFDKGLDDGIEGGIFGFNMVLESVFDKKRKFNHYEFQQPPVSKIILPTKNFDHPNEFLPIKASQVFADYTDSSYPTSQINTNLIRRSNIVYVPLNRNLLRSTPYRRVPRVRNFNRRYIGHRGWEQPKRNFSNGNRIPSLGYRLVDLTYRLCLKGRGAPLSGPKVLVSWTLTVSRVFGGAILKPINQVCGHF